ncbi:MAG: M20/M25/M40 family metallo-hydrolase [Gammaproteobacteria bacterium]|nr:M20/M25/M40 family metallo-hydrolase [Gammaproteobacteria bacterium]MDH4254973.1 M20/M25/M40 family metallo-hydrolase [Gammaproteobacteria bacterium]MDH5310212.1 M20/M25/M40 family metallo-hydrolase [Gammaproteobacteria bacterium]
MFQRFVAINLLLVAAANPQTLEDEAVAWLTDYLKIDTINPPGNESRAVEYIGAILDAEGISWQAAESAPGRGNLWARLEGGDEPALILLQHTDVVPADPNYWTTEPLSGEIRDGYIWGRGTLDMKGTGISQLATFIALHRAGLPLNRDVVLIASADEEAGGYYGAGWLVENHRDIFEGAGLLINEGGSGELSSAGETLFSVEVTQKVPVWLRLTAVDTPGHGSTPRATSSVTRIVAALNHLLENPFPPRIIPAVDAMFQGIAQSASAEWSDAYADIASAIKQPGFLDRLQAHSPFLHALTRDACSLTRLQGSNKINVVPPESWAEIDCRILPDRPAEVFVDELRAALAPMGVTVDVIMAFTPAVSDTNTRLYRAIEAVTSERHPGSRVMPSVSTGFTDSHFTRDLGIASYGFDPVIVPEEDSNRVHGNDERVSEAAFRRGVSDHLAVIEAVVYE